MSHSVDLRAIETLNNLENPIKDKSNCQSLTDHQNTTLTPPLKLEMNINSENGKFDQFMDFVERVKGEKNSKEISDEIQNELRNWFPFVNKNMTVYLNIELYVKNDSAFKGNTVEKTLTIPKMKFPEPLARFSPINNKHDPITIDKQIFIEGKETEIVPKKLFIPGFKQKIDSKANNSFESSNKKKNIKNILDIELDNIHLSTLLRKKNGDLPDVTRIAANRQFRPNELNEKLISNHILKVRNYWNGSNISYPYSFKRLSLDLTEKSHENYIVETLDQSKKLIPTMFSEQNSELWNRDGN